MIKKLPVAQLFWIFLIHAYFMGCISYPQKHSFILNVDRETTERPVLTEKPLIVSRFRSAPQYESKGFVYRKGELDYESDYYNHASFAINVPIAKDPFFIKAVGQSASLPLALCNYSSFTPQIL